MSLAIVVNQAGKPAGEAGIAREDLALGVAAQLSITGGPYLQVQWSIVDKPEDLSIPVQSSAALSAPNNPSTNLSPIDNDGTYFVQVAVDAGFGLGARPADNAQITFYAGATLASSWNQFPRRVPAFQETTQHNVKANPYPSGNPKGWSLEVRRIFGAIAALSGASMPVLDTITQLRAQVAGSTESYQVRGYGAPGDWGQKAVFDLDPSDLASADNGGTIIVAGTKRFKRRGTESGVDVRWFGAFGLGADEAIPIQNAINVGGRVFGPIRTFIIETPLNLVDNLLIDFLPGSVFKAKNGTIYTAVFAGSNKTNVVIRGLIIDANGPNRPDMTNTKECIRHVGMTDFNVEECTGLNTLGIGGSAVAFACTGGTRVRYLGVNGRNLGVPGRISDCFYSNGEDIFLANCDVRGHTDTAYVFENASDSGGVNLRADGLGAGAGLAMGVAGNADVGNNFFDNVVLRNLIAPIEFGLFGPRTNTGKLKNCTFGTVIIDSPTSTFPALFFYPNPQVNPGALAYSGRIVNTVVEDLQVFANGGSQGVYATQFDGLYVNGLSVNVTAAALQTAEGNPTDLRVTGVKGNVSNPATIGIQVGPGCDKVFIDSCQLHSPDTMVWGVFCFGTSTNVDVTPNNEWTSDGGLNDENGVGGDNTTQPRKPATWYGTTTPQPNTGIWPKGSRIRNTNVLVTEDTAHPDGWLCTTAGPAGAGAVFTPEQREARSVNAGGVFNSNAYQHNKSTVNNRVTFNARPNGTSFTAFAFSNDDNTGGNLGFFAGDGNGNLRLSALAGLSIGFNTNAQFDATTYTEVFSLSATGWRSTVNLGGYFFGSTSQFGGVQHLTSVANGVIAFGGSVRSEFGVYNGGVWTPGAFARMNAGGQVCSIGINSDPSDVNTLLKFAAATANYSQSFMVSSGAVPVGVVNGSSYYSANGPQFDHDSKRYNVGLSTAAVAFNFNPGLIAGGTSVLITINSVTGAVADDGVDVRLPTTGIEDGLVYTYWVSAADTVKVLVRNVTGGNITPTSVNWHIVAKHK